MNKLREAVNFYRYVGFSREKPLGKPDATTLSIFASPRGGSTWLAQTLNKLPSSALVWEPLLKYNQYKINKFNPFAYPERSQVNIAWNQYIPEGASWPEVELFFDKLFNREIVNLKLYRFNDLRELSDASYFVFKFCFGNNLLPWLAKRYPINPVFLMRHPCAVVASQLNFSAFNWHKSNIQYNYNMSVFGEEFYEPYRAVLDTISTVEERLAAQWAMSVLTPAKSPLNDSSWVTVTYEHLVRNPEEALNKIITRYHLPETGEFLSNIRETSFTKSSFGRKTNDERLEGWRKSLSAKQIRLILNFTERMGVDFYSDELEANYGKIYK